MLNIDTVNTESGPFLIDKCDEDGSYVPLTTAHLKRMFRFAKLNNLKITELVVSTGLYYQAYAKRLELRKDKGFMDSSSGIDIDIITNADFANNEWGMTTIDYIYKNQNAHIMKAKTASPPKQRCYFCANFVEIGNLCASCDSEIG